MEGTEEAMEVVVREVEEMVAGMAVVMVAAAEVGVEMALEERVGVGVVAVALEE